MTDEINLDEVEETTEEESQEEIVVETETEESDTDGDIDGIIVEEPEILRPKELPLVVKPQGGKWANPEQEEYAQTLNGYAYANPEKWRIKKAKLLANLKNLATNPQDIVKHRGLGGMAGVGRMEYSNKAFGPGANSI